MARNNDRDRSTRRAPKDNGRRMKKKVCIFCKDRIDYVDYKDVNLLRKFMSDRGKIRARRVSGNCAQHQREVAVAIKTSRELALLPYTQRTTTERPGGRTPSRGRSGFSSEGRDGREGRAPAETTEVVADETAVPSIEDIDTPDVEVPEGAEL
jgi:small subunit ribosomal protein S18